MQKIIRVITFILFFIWILPLGVFIQPQDEEKACNGRRAICLCRHLIKKYQERAEGHIFLKSSGAGIEKEGASSSGQNFLLSSLAQTHEAPIHPHLISSPFLYNFHIIRTIEHVPKT